MPRLLDFDRDHERLLKEYVDGPTIYDLVLQGPLPDTYFQQVREMCRALCAHHLNIDYFPTNFVVRDGLLHYIDFECNGYMVVNIARTKSLGNQRSSTADISVQLTPPRTFTLEEALEYIMDLKELYLLTSPSRSMSAEFIRVEKGDYQTRLPDCYKGEFAEMASSFNHLIEKIKEDTDVLKVSEARYALIMEETNQVVFEWDIQRNHIYHTVYWTNKFGFSTEALRPGSNVPNFDQVHRDDQRALADFFRKILEGGQSKPIDVRIKTIQGTYIWCTINMIRLISRALLPGIDGLSARMKGTKEYSSPFMIPGIMNRRVHKPMNRSVTNIAPTPLK